MGIEELCRSFLEALSKRDPDQVLAFFVPDARVNSPLFGVVPAPEYFQKLFESAWYKGVRLLGFYLPANFSASAILHFNCSAAIIGETTEFEWVGIFDLAASRRQFASMTIIYDPSKLQILESSNAHLPRESFREQPQNSFAYAG